MKTTFFVAIGVVVGMFLWHFIQNLAPITFTSETPKSASISYSDFVSILLTGISIILAALGFVIAILAFIGWNSIGAKVKEAAEDFLKESVDDGGELHEAVRKEAREIYRYLGVEPLDTEFDENGDNK